MAKDMIKLFAWKNCKSIKSNLFTKCLLLVGSLIVILCYLKTTYVLRVIPETKYETESIEMLRSRFTSGDDDFIYYYPGNNSYINGIMEGVRQDLNIPSEKFQSFVVKNEMFLSLDERHDTRSFAVCFTTDPNHIQQKHRMLNYSITSTSSKLSTIKKFYNDEEIVDIKQYDDYISSGYWILKYFIDMNFVKLSSQQNIFENLEIETAPIPHIETKTVDSMRTITFGILFLIPFYVILLTTYLIPSVEERQDGIAEFLILSTPYHYYNDITFYMIRLVVYLIYGVIALVIGIYYSAIQIEHFVIASSLFIFFIIAAMCLAHCISACFNKVFAAKIGGFILLFGPCLTYCIDNLSLTGYILCGNTFLEGMQILQAFTNKHHIVNIGSLFGNITDKSFKLITIYILLILQSCFYFLLYAIKTKKFRLWKNIVMMRIFNMENQLKLPTILAENPQNNRSSVTIKDLSKTYNKNCNRNSFEAVKNISMNIDKKCITVLLGHNGAGKTTVINMIAGVTERTSGEIIIYNSEIYNQSEQHSKSLLGYCPQHNIFMQYMTCLEHLIFFGCLRGMSLKDAKISADHLLSKLKLSDKGHKFGRDLSGGMKRRLSLGIAVIGNTKIIILDEPSSGLDPKTRRTLWDILLDLRKTCSILVTTHHMEEAEILGDKIIILSHGEIRKTGSSLELKRKCGSGYILKLLTNAKFDKGNVLSAIQNKIPNARIHGIVEPTIYITLPYADSDKYPEVLTLLENGKNEFGVDALSVTDTSLEEVFLNLEHDSDEVDSITYKTLPAEEVCHVDMENMEIEQCQQNLNVYAIFYKKFVYMKTEYIYFITMCLLPIIATILSFLLISLSGNRSMGSKSLELNLYHLPSSEIYFNIHDENLFPKLRTCISYEMNKYNSKAIFLDGNQIEDDLINKQKQNLSGFYDSVLGGLDISREGSKIKIKLLYSTNILHSSVIMLNVIDNIILQNFECAGQRIETFNLPFNPVKGKGEVSPFRLDYYSLIMPIGWFLYIMLYLTLPFMEERSGFKSLQTVPSLTYWAATTLFDIILHCFICTIVLLIHSVFLPMNIYNISELMIISSAYMLYGLAYIPILYIFGSMFRSISTISSFLFLIFLISTIAPIITSSNIQTMQDYTMFIHIMCFLPDFLLKHQLKIINENYFIRRLNEATIYFPTQPQNIGRRNAIDYLGFYFYAIFLFILSEIFLIFIWEDVNRRDYLKKIFTLRWRTLKSKPTNAIKLKPNKSTEIDEDVQNEHDQVDEITKNNTTNIYPLLVKNLNKTYGEYEQQQKIVNNVNFAVNKGECFGLLGLNGAGKTTLFEMITANKHITNGEIYINGISIQSERNQYKELIGYCPQIDAVDNFMTSYQILKYMGLMRGISKYQIDDCVRSILKEFQILKYENVQICNYSGGTKRKLNTAMAIIGNPDLILLDEPTTGVDPVSRRFIWQIIQKCQRNHKTIVLTSHSMDECENLCNRLVIMSGGVFKCIAPITALKTKYGNGFTISLRINENFTNDVNHIELLIKDMIKLFNPHCRIRERHAEMLTFFIEDVKIVWSSVFEKFNNFYKTNADSLTEYSINETSLEDIFLKFDENNDKENVPVNV